MDIDEVTRGSNAVIRPKDRQDESTDAEALRYLGLDAICRRHFPVVLDRGARSATVFCQQTCNGVFGANLMVDGRWGDKTEDAMKGAQVRTGVSGDLTDSAAWQDWLRRVAEIALQGRTAP